MSEDRQYIKPEDMTQEQCKVDFDLRVKVYYTLVGSIYPSIVYDELWKLRKLYFEAGGDEQDVRMPPPPNAAGYVGGYPR